MGGKRIWRLRDLIQSCFCLFYSHFESPFLDWYSFWLPSDECNSCEFASFACEQACDCKLFERQSFSRYGLYLLLFWRKLLVLFLLHPVLTVILSRSWINSNPSTRRHTSQYCQLNTRDVSHPMGKGYLGLDIVSNPSWCSVASHVSPNYDDPVKGPTWALYAICAAGALHFQLIFSLATIIVNLQS